MKGETRCIDGRTFRHDPQPDDPDLETDVGQCEECNGRGCQPPLTAIECAREKEQQTLVDSYEAGDMGMVEFTELALAAGMSIEAIGKILEAGQDVF